MTLGICDHKIEWKSDHEVMVDLKLLGLGKHVKELKGHLLARDLDSCKECTHTHTLTHMHSYTVEINVLDQHTDCWAPRVSASSTGNQI